MPIWLSDTSSKVVLGTAVGLSVGLVAYAFYQRSIRRSMPETSSIKSFDSNALLSNDQKSNLNLEEQSLLAGGPRVKFASEWIGTLEDFFAKEPGFKDKYEEVCEQLAEQMSLYEEVGVTPVAPDGKVGGNCSAVIHNETGSCIVVSKSGKAPRKKMDIMSDFVIIAHFDPDNWACAYYAQNKSTLPTSDAPLHFAILNDTQMDMNWSEYPQVALHGHAFETEEEAEKNGYPISTELTLFSTPEDTAALMGLLKRHPYPEDNIFVRKGHGFMLLASDPDDAKAIFEKRIKPHLG